MRRKTYVRMGLSLRLYAKTVNTSSTNRFADVNAFYRNDNVRDSLRIILSITATVHSVSPSAPATFAIPCVTYTLRVAFTMCRPSIHKRVCGSGRLRRHL
jgi:hypothetical protein